MTATWRPGAGPAAAAAAEVVVLDRAIGLTMQQRYGPSETTWHTTPGWARDANASGVLEDNKQKQETLPAFFLDTKWILEPKWIRIYNIYSGRSWDDKIRKVGANSRKPNMTS